MDRSMTAPAAAVAAASREMATGGRARVAVAADREATLVRVDSRSAAVVAVGLRRATASLRVNRAVAAEGNHRMFSDRTGAMTLRALAAAVVAAPNTHPSST